MFKSIFITIYVAYLLIGGIITGIHFAQDLDSLTAFAAMLTHALAAFWFVYIYTMSKANASFMSILITVGSGITALISFASFKINQDGLVIDSILAAIAFFGWFLYNFGYAKQAKDKTGFSIGNLLPDGKLINSEGEAVSIHSISGKCLLVFHRGDWCPFCVDHKNDLNAHLDEFQAKGTSVVFISSQAPKSKAYGEGIYDLQDEDVAYGKQIGLNAGPILPLGLSLFGFKSSLHEPYAVLIDENKKIITFHKSNDYRVRPSASYFLRFLA
ncbi:MAG: hypothetical protein ACJAU0_001264 [Flavobacteriales bacterium]|jgi:hypothetical protein